MFDERSQEKELIDLGKEYFSQDEYTDCLHKLFRINKLFGFFQSTVKTLRSFPTSSSLLDIGCGGGLFILHLSKLFPEMKMIGIDISSDAISDAEKSRQMWLQKNPHLQVFFHLQNNTKLDFDKNSFDIITATLVCHHLSNEELIEFLKQVYFTANKAVIINDLHRHYFSYWFYRLISPLIFRNRLITHDGLISIKRGFIRKEWHSLLRQAGIQHYQLKWCFPFRWKLILLK